MAVLSTLKKDRLGEWKSLADYLSDLRRRETNSLAALGSLLAASPAEQRELAAGEALPILVEVAADLRVPKGSRLAAARCAMESGLSGTLLASLFVGAGDLATDPRLGAAAKKLVETGLPAALEAGAGREISLEAGAFARAVQAGASAVGQARISALLKPAPAGHAGAAAALFGLGAAALSTEHRAAWGKLLSQTCAAHRSAPAAARRMGLAPAWPPSLPDAFAPLVKEAEAAAAALKTEDAVAAAPKPAPPGGPRSPRPAPSVPAVPTGAVEMGTKKTLAPIKPSPFRRAIGTVVEGPVTLPPKPMPPVSGRAPAPAPPDRPVVPPPPEVSDREAPLPGIMPLLRREEPLRFDPRGKRIPRADRWQERDFDWERPILPEPVSPPVRRAAQALGPFAQRLDALFRDRPEAVERLCAAVEARSAVSGLGATLAEVSAELAHPRWKGRRAPPAQLERLSALNATPSQPEAWRAAAALLLTRLGIPPG
jgi:hypothetical protein